MNEVVVTFLKSHYVSSILALFLIICFAHNLEAQVVSPPPYYAVKLSNKYVSESFVRERWLGFLKESSTTRHEVLDHLGEPTEQYNGGQIIAYRLLLSEYDRDDLLHFLRLWCQGTMKEEGWEADINKRREALSNNEHLIVFRHELREELLPELIAREAEYSLVIVFDEQDVLKNSSLKRILP